VNRKTSLTMLVSVLILLLIAMGVCGYFLYLELQKPDVMEQYDYEEIQAMVEVPPDDPEQEAFALQYDTQALLAENADFLGWLYIPDTHINLPVVAGSDNSWYLTHSFTKKYSCFGCPFLDINTPVGSRNRVIHGHNMGRKRTEMFSCLLDYADQTYAETHKQLYFSEPGVEGETYEIFAVLNFDLNRLDELNYMQPAFQTEEEFISFVAYLKEKSLYETTYAPDSQIIILSTCNRQYGEHNRFLVCAGKLPSQETGAESESHRNVSEPNQYE